MGIYEREESMYLDASVVVDGALEEDSTFYDYLFFEEWLRGVEEDAESHGYLTEIYVVEHAHSVEDGADCACVQYLTDHHPYRTFNADSVESPAS